MDTPSFLELEPLSLTDNTEVKVPVNSRMTKQTHISELAFVPAVHTPCQVSPTESGISLQPAQSPTLATSLVPTSPSGLSDLLSSGDLPKFEEYYKLRDLYTSLPATLCVNQILLESRSSESDLENIRSSLFEMVKDCEDFPFGFNCELKRRVHTRSGESVPCKLAKDIYTLISVLEGEDFSEVNEMVSKSRSQRPKSTNCETPKSNNMSSATKFENGEIKLLRDKLSSMEADILLSKQRQIAIEKTRSEEIIDLKNQLSENKFLFQQLTNTVNEQCSKIHESFKNVPLNKEGVDNKHVLKLSESVTQLQIQLMALCVFVNYKPNIPYSHSELSYNYQQTHTPPFSESIEPGSRSKSTVSKNAVDTESTQDVDTSQLVATKIAPTYSNQTMIPNVSGSIPCAQNQVSSIQMSKSAQCATGSLPLPVPVNMAAGVLAEDAPSPNKYGSMPPLPVLVDYATSSLAEAASSPCSTGSMPLPGPVEMATGTVVEDASSLLTPGSASLPDPVDLAVGNLAEVAPSPVTYDPMSPVPIPVNSVAGTLVIGASSLLKSDSKPLSNTGEFAAGNLTEGAMSPRAPKIKPILVKKKTLVCSDISQRQGKNVTYKDALISQNARTRVHNNMSFERIYREIGKPQEIIKPIPVRISGEMWSARDDNVDHDFDESEFVKFVKKRNRVKRFYIGGFLPSVPESYIQSYVSRSGFTPTKVTIFRNWKYNSATIRLNVVDCPTIDDIVQSRFWPRGVTCRPWVTRNKYKRDRRQGSENDAQGYDWSEYDHAYDDQAYDQSQYDHFYSEHSGMYSYNDLMSNRSMSRSNEVD